MTIRIDNPIVGSAGSLTVDDDGTYYNFKVGGTTLFKIRKSDNQLILDAGVSADGF